MSLWGSLGTYGLIQKLYFIKKLFLSVETRIVVFLSVETRIIIISNDIDSRQLFFHCVDIRE